MTQTNVSDNELANGNARRDRDRTTDKDSIDNIFCNSTSSTLISKSKCHKNCDEVSACNYSEENKLIHSQYKKDKQFVLLGSKNNLESVKQARLKCGKRGRVENACDVGKSTVEVIVKNVNDRKNEEMLSMLNSAALKSENKEERETTKTRKKKRRKEEEVGTINSDYAQVNELGEKCCNSSSTKLKYHKESVSEKQETLYLDETHKNFNELSFANAALLNAFGWKLCKITSEPFSEANSCKDKCNINTIKWAYTLQHIASKDILTLELVTSACNFSTSPKCFWEEPNKQFAISRLSFNNDRENVEGVSDDTHNERHETKDEWVTTTHIYSINGQKFTSEHDAILFLLSKSITAMISTHGVVQHLRNTDQVTESSEHHHFNSYNDKHLLPTNNEPVDTVQEKKSDNNIVNEKIKFNNDCTKEVDEVHSTNRDNSWCCENRQKSSVQYEKDHKCRSNNNKILCKRSNKKQAKCETEKVKQEVREENEPHESLVELTVTPELAATAASSSSSPSTLEHEEYQEKEKLLLLEETSILELPRNAQRVKQHEGEKRFKKIHAALEQSTSPSPQRVNSPEQQRPKKIEKTKQKIKEQKKSSLSVNGSKEGMKVGCENDVPQEEPPIADKRTHFAKKDAVKREQSQHEPVNEKENEEIKLEKRSLTMSLPDMQKSQKHFSFSCKKNLYAKAGHGLQPLSSITTLSGIKFDGSRERETKLSDALSECSSSSSPEQKREMPVNHKILLNHRNTGSNTANLNEPLSSSAQYLKYVRSFSHHLNLILEQTSYTHDKFAHSHHLSSLHNKENTCACTKTVWEDDHLLHGTIPVEEELRKSECKKISSCAEVMARSLAEVVGSEELSGDTLYAGVSALNQYFTEREQEQKVWETCKMSNEKHDVNVCGTNDLMCTEIDIVCDDVESDDLRSDWDLFNENTITTNSSENYNTSEHHKLCKYFPRPTPHTFLPVHGKILRALQRNVNSTILHSDNKVKLFDILPDGIPLAPRVAIPRTYHRRHEWILHMTHPESRTEVHGDGDKSIKANLPRQHVQFTLNLEYDIWEYVNRRFGRVETSASVFASSSDINNDKRETLFGIKSESNNSNDGNVYNNDKSNGQNKEVDESLPTCHSHVHNKKEKKAIDMDRYLRANRDKIMPVPMPDV